MSLNLITDRTLADASYAAANPGSAERLKGAYNDVDYNRVGAALNAMAALLVEYGFMPGPTLRTDWTETEPISYQDATAYLGAVRQVRDMYYGLHPKPPLPDSLNELFSSGGHERANDIERSLLELEASLERVASAWFMSGEIMSGEI